MLIKIIIFSAAWLILLYVLASLAAGKRIPLRRIELLISVVVTAVLGVCGEFLIDILYTQITGHQLWQYRFTPIHGGDTSWYSISLWASMGFYIYLLRTVLKRWNITSIHLSAVIFSFVAMSIEACVNLSFLVLFGWHMYYFFPGDLWHITSAQTLPIYLGLGYAVFNVLRLTERFNLASSQPVRNHE